MQKVYTFGIFWSTHSVVLLVILENLIHTIIDFNRKKVP